MLHRGFLCTSAAKNHQSMVHPLPWSMVLKAPSLLCQQNLQDKQLPLHLILGKRTAQKAATCCCSPRVLSFSRGSSHIHDYTHSGLKWVVAVPMTDTMAANTSSSNSTFLIIECSFSVKSKQQHTPKTTHTQTQDHDYGLFFKIYFY